MEEDMPQGNRTGPEGAGPMTGRAMGYCAGYEMAGFETAPGGRAGRGLGLGLGRRFGGGRGGASFRRAGGFGGGLGAGRGRAAAYGGRFSAGLGRSYWNEGAETGEAREASLREEIDLLSNRLELLKRELDSSAKGPGTPSEDE